MENYENSVSLDDFPLIYHPAYVHTNIQGGTGLVGSYTSAEQILNIPLKNENTDFYPPSAGLE